jgi:hypothetical protein
MAEKVHASAVLIGKADGREGIEYGLVIQCGDGLTIDLCTLVIA